MANASDAQTDGSIHQSNMATPKDSATQQDTSATNQTAQAVSAKANNLAQKISKAKGAMNQAAANNSVMQNILGTSTGHVSPREQAAMGATHMAAAMVGMQDVTQRGVDQINRRNGKEARSNASSLSQSAPLTPGQSAQIVNETAEAMEERDRIQDVERQRRIASLENLIRNNRNN